MLGGTLFLGRHVVEALLARGHEVTLFHRGQRGADLFPQLERVLGDRATDLDRLPAGARWDAVVDTSGYLPGVVATSANALRERAERYVFVSTIGVHDAALPALDESSPIVELPPDASREVMVPETYGALKALCERAAAEAFGPERALVVRPGLIVGPHDPTDRFTYWPLRFARGGDVLVPDDLGAAVQIIDARDLADFVVHAIERRTAGVVNAVGPAERLTLRELLAACAGASDAPSRIVPVPLATLAEHEIGEWMDLPTWIDPNGESLGMRAVSTARGIAMGMRYRPLAETVADTLRWARDERGDAPLKAGLTPEREIAALAAAPRGSSR
jgi:2'-hydroxyisoflavone reductase